MAKELTKPGFINKVLWVAYFLAMVASLQHLAWVFGTVERYPVLGWLAAVAVDCGLAALAYSIQQRRKAKRGALALWVGVIFFAGISMLANLYHALSVESGGVFALNALQFVDWLLMVKAVALSASLPLLVIYLGEIVSSDDVAEAEKLAKEAEKALKKQQAEEDKQRKAEEEAKKPPEPAFKCDVCGRSFKTNNALSGHAKAHRIAT